MLAIILIDEVFFWAVLDRSETIWHCLLVVAWSLNISQAYHWADLRLARLENEYWRKAEKLLNEDRPG